MIALLSTVLIGTAGIVALSVIGYMVGTRWHRIVRLATGHVEPEFHPLWPQAAHWHGAHLAADQREPFDVAA